MKRIELMQGDLTKVKVDAVVNTANSSLLGGGGVDGAIHRAAGSELAMECRMLNGCKTGAAKLTKGYRLPAKYIIHTVGPVWRGGEHGEAELLAACYRSSLQLAEEYQVKSIAFPAISTGIYRFPKELASQIAFRELEQHLSGETNLERVVLVCYDQENYEVYQKLLELK